MTRGARREDGPCGFTMIETIVSVGLLGVISITVLGGLLFGMTQARSGLNRAGAAAWAQAEFDYLRVQGYANLAAGTRTLTQTTGYTTYGSIAEPPIPAGFDHAVVTIGAVATPPVKQVTVTLYQTASSAYTTISTYVGNYTQPAP